MYRILIIDDEPDILDILTNEIQLMSLGVQVLVAQTVEQACELLHEADAVIADVLMPKSRELEATLLETDAPKLRISGSPHANIPALQKPFSFEVLELEIGKLILAVDKKKENV